MSILVDADTTFIVQGITGREAVNLTRECLDYGAGAKIVGGVTPGPAGPRGPRRAGLRHRRPGRRAPRRADRRLGRHRPPAFTKDAVFEAIENGVKLIVIVTERIPRRDVAADGRARHPARRAHHRPQLPRDHRPRRDQDGRHRRPGQGRREVLHAGPDRRDLPLGRHDDRDVLDAERRRPRAVDRRLDRRRRDHRLDLRRADAAVRGRRADPGHRHLHRARRPHGGRAGALGDRERLAPADRRVHGRPVHGRDARHELRPRRHDRRGQGGHGDREDRPPRGGRHHRRRGDLADSRVDEGSSREAGGHGVPSW